MHSIEKYIHESKPGFLKIPLLKKVETEFVQKIIFEKIKKLNSKNNVIADDFETLMQSYNDQIHECLKLKKNRIFDFTEAENFLALDSIVELQTRFPNHLLGNVTFGHLSTEKRPEIYFRVVRPGKPEDVGPIHCDKWFNELYGLGYGGCRSVKVWLSIFTEVGLNGLLISPGSHRINYEYAQIMTNDGPRPVPKFLEDSVYMELVDASPGDAVIFSESILHAGAVNNGLYPRVSIELAFFEKI